MNDLEKYIELLKEAGDLAFSAELRAYGSDKKLKNHYFPMASKLLDKINGKKKEYELLLEKRKALDKSVQEYLEE